jgi:SSS family solute:Na+ symporter
MPDAPTSFESYSFNDFAFNKWMISLTATATWTGGSFIMGSVGAFYAYGMQWGLQWFGFYASTFFFGYLYFNQKIKEGGYLSTIDLIQSGVGKRAPSATMGLLISTFSEILWISSILLGCGNLFVVFFDTNKTAVIIIISIFCSIYTLIGGFKAVVYTDVVQMILVVFTLYVVMINLCMNYTVDIGASYDAIDYYDSYGPWNYMEWWLVSVLGSLTWNSYYHRIIASKSGAEAKESGLIALLGITVVFLPVFFIGIISPQIQFNALDEAVANPELVYPLILKDIVHPVIGWIGVIGVCMAVLSSFDSSTFATATLLTLYYSNMSAEMPSDAQKTKISKCLIVGLSIIQTFIALVATNVSDLVYMTNDIPSMTLFPIIFATLLCPKDIHAGCAFAGMFIAFVIRILSGLLIFEWESIIPWPIVGVASGSEYPFRTIAFLANTTILWAGIYYNKRNPKAVVQEAEMKKLAVKELAVKV